MKLRVQSKLGVLIFLALVAVVAFGSSSVGAQALTGAPVMPQYRYSTAMPPGVASPDTVRTRFGTLKFFDGVPDDGSIEKLYENLDFPRAAHGYLLGLAAVNQCANRRGSANGDGQFDRIDL